MNKENFKLILDKIKKDPNSWDQNEWHSTCGTKHCFAGHCQIEMGRSINADTVREDAAEFLEIPPTESWVLFDVENTIEDFEDILTRGHILRVDITYE